MGTFAVFFLWFVLAELLLSAAQFLLRRKKSRPLLRALIIAGKFLLAILSAFLPMAGPVQLRAVQPFMMAAYVAVFADAAADAAVSAVLAIRKKERRFSVYKTVSLVCGVLFLVYGVVNMEVVTPKEHVYTSEKLTREHTVAFIADLHVGSAQPFSVTEKTIEEVRALRPEATVLGGDIVDDYTTKEEMEATFRLFGEFDTPVYYLYGNHDRQGHAEYAGGKKFTREELEKAMTDNGVIILKDAYAELSDEVLLLGREDLTEKEGRADVSSLPNPDPEKFLIVADHQPVDFKNNLKSGCDLQLSGHTHAGQLFPLGLFYNVIGYNYGDYREGGAVMNVSAGACGWRVPLRTEAHCHYEVVRLVPENGNK